MSGLGQLLAEAFSRGCECQHWILSVSPSPSLKSSLKLDQTFALTLIWAREQLFLRATVRFPLDDALRCELKELDLDRQIVLPDHACIGITFRNIALS
jgi:hypothetical protein